MDRDAADLRVDRGVRKPCYSTHMSSSFLTSHESGDGGTGHSAPIVQIESLGDPSSQAQSVAVVSQFISLDKQGEGYGCLSPFFSIAIDITVK
jgi:hypothetical protein